MPLLAWLNVVMAGLVILAVSPLTAAQIMLSVESLSWRHFFDTQAGGSAALWMHFFWIFGHPEVYVLVIPRIRVCVRDHPGIFTQTDFRISGDGRGNDLHRLHWYERLGPSHVHDRHELQCQRFCRVHDHGHRRSDRHQDLQLARHDVGRQDPVQDTDAFLHRIPFQFLIAGLTGVMMAVAPFDLATRQFLLRGRALSLRDRGAESCSVFLVRSTIGFPKSPEGC